MEIYRLLPLCLIFLSMALSASANDLRVLLPEHTQNEEVANPAEAEKQGKTEKPKVEFKVSDTDDSPKKGPQLGDASGKEADPLKALVNEKPATAKPTQSSTAPAAASDETEVDLEEADSQRVKGSSDDRIRLRLRETVLPQTQSAWKEPEQWEIVVEKVTGRKATPRKVLIKAPADPFKPHPPVVEDSSELQEKPESKPTEEPMASESSGSEPEPFLPSLEELEPKKDDPAVQAVSSDKTPSEGTVEPQPLADMAKDAKSIRDEKKKAEPTPQATPKQNYPAHIAQLEGRIQRVIKYHQDRPSDATKLDVWEMMHDLLPYGVDAKVRTSKYPNPVSSIGWICWNQPCRGHRLFDIKDGEIFAKQGPRVQGHHGQFLAMMAQSYVGPTYEIRVEGKKFNVADLIEFEKKTCEPDTELTFKLLALSHYLPADATWSSKDGQHWDFERLLKEEIKQKVVGAACGGTHRLTGIAFAVNARKKAGLPMDGIWAKAEEYLDSYHSYTFRLQNRDGSFSTRWFEGRGMENNIDRRIQTSGHILEFLIYSVPQERLTSPEMVKAVKYVLSILEQNPRQDWSIGPKAHALHALALYDQKVFGNMPGSARSEIAKTSK